MLAAAALVSACGSTVQMSGSRVQAQGGPVGPDGLGGSTAAPGATGEAAPQPGVVTRTGGTTQGPVPQGTTASQRATAVPVPTWPARGFGFTEKELYIGVAYDSTLSTELGGAGVGSASVGDQKRQVEAIVADLNAHGGIAARKVVPVFYDTKGSNSQNDPNTLAQAACARWTQDTHVFAAMTYVVQMDNTSLYSCLANKHVLFVPLAGESTATFARYSPYLWSPAGVTPEQVAPLWAQRLKALGYFTGWNPTLGRAGSNPVRIGLLYGNGTRNNQPELDRSFVAAVTKALGSVGQHVVDSFEITNNQASLAAAVLHFQNSNVTHVIGDYSVVNFTQAAESQHYRPRYAQSSFSGGVAMKLFAPPGQLHGAIGIGWVPSGDVQADRDPGGPAQTRCRSVMEKAGQSTSVRLAWFAMTWACDTFSFFSRVLPASHLVPDNLPAAAAAIGTLPGSFTFAMSFARGRRAGGAIARDYGYVDSCSCFAYLSRKDMRL